MDVHAWVRGGTSGPAAFGRTAQRVCAAYSAALPDLNLPLRVSMLRLLPDFADEGVAEVRVEFVHFEKADGFHMARVYVPEAVRDLDEAVRALLVLDVACLGSQLLAERAGWDPALLAPARERALAAGLRWRWEGRWKSSPDRKRRARYAQIEDWAPLPVIPVPAIPLDSPRPTVVRWESPPPPKNRLVPGGGGDMGFTPPGYPQALVQTLDQLAEPAWQEWWAAADLGPLEIGFLIGPDADGPSLRRRRGRHGDQVLAGQVQRGYGTVDADADLAAIARDDVLALMEKVRKRAKLPPLPPLAKVEIDWATVRLEQLGETDRQLLGALPLDHPFDNL